MKFDDYLGKVMFVSECILLEGSVVIGKSSLAKPDAYMSNSWSHT